MVLWPLSRKELVVNLTEATKIAEAVVVIASVSGVGILWTTIKTYKESNESLKQRLEIVEEETKQCNLQHQENVQQIKKLEGKVEAYGELALIPKDFLIEMQANQKAIIKLLKK